MMNRYFALFLVVYAAALLVTLNLNYILWDEGSFLTTALHYAGISSHYAEDYFRAPLLPFVAGLVFPLSGNYVLAGKLLVIAASIGGIIYLYKIARELFDEKTALLAAVLMALFPLYFFYSKIFFADVPAMFLSFVSIYYFLKKKPLHSGLFLGLSFLARYHMGVVTGAVFLVFMIADRTKIIDKKFGLDYKPFFWLAVTAFITITPWLVYNQITWGSFAYPMTNTLSIMSADVQKSSLYFFENLFEFMPLPYLIFILGMFLMAKDRSYKNIFILLWFFAFFILIHALVFKEVRFFIYAVPALSVSLSFTIIRISARQRTAGVIILALCLLAAVYYDVGFSQYGYTPGYGNEKFDYETTKAISYFIKNSTDADAKVAANSLWPVIAYYAERNVTAARNIADIDKASFFVYYSMNFFDSNLAALKQKYEVVQQYSEGEKEIYLFRVV
jgi:4-amino-4-deoxy-L-arabinose transferase-like glycosyltransferase